MTREAEWDDYERDKMFALDIHDSEVHHDGCGFHKTLAGDPNNLFLPRGEYCPLCAAVAARGREQAAEYQEALKRVAENPSAKLPTDGLRVRTQMLSGAEAERRRTQARQVQATSHSM